jgi:aryl-alcohol dehydrogenase-like predicted oxidoreductase
VKGNELGRTGLKVSEVCLGTMTFGQRVDAATSLAILDLADEAGVTFVDTADVYPPPGGPALWGRAEKIVGLWLQARGARHRIVVATKVGRPMGDGPDDQGLSRKHILRACDDSLKRLQTDYIDLYQVHAPDPNVPIDETLRALDDLVHAGKVRHIGCSNYSAQQLTEAFAVSAALGCDGFASLQLPYNLLSRACEQELLPLCAARGIGVLAYSPLAGGSLTDGRSKMALQESQHLHPGVPGPRSAPEASRAGPEVTHLHRLLAARGKSLTHVALAWVLAQPHITSAIVGTSRPDQLADTLRGVGSDLDDEEWAACDALWRNHGARQDQKPAEGIDRPAGSPSSRRRVARLADPHPAAGWGGEKATC